MQVPVLWGSRVSEKFPELTICIDIITSLHVEKENEQIQELEKVVYEEVRTKYNIETLKDNPTVRAYREFYWKLDIDPTKTRPSGEALPRRVLHGKELPRISTVVDAYNLFNENHNTHKRIRQRPPKPTIPDTLRKKR